MAAITKPEVEARNIQRVIKKAQTFSQEVVVSPTKPVQPQEADAQVNAYFTTCKVDGITR